MPPRFNLADIAQRATVTGLVGMGIWGFWLTAAVWKSRRDDRAIQGILGFSPESAARSEEEARQFQAQAKARINPPPTNPS